MKRFIFMRVIAQFIDIIVSLAIFVATFVVVVPFASKLFDNPTFLAVFGLLFSIAAMFLIQWPFLTVYQTIGKALCGLEIVSTNPDQPLTTANILRRELLMKLATLYFICIPVFTGERGGHEAATQTAIIKKARTK